jgi:hypothetical protein
LLKNQIILFLRTLRCACYPLLRPYNSHKLLPRSDGCVFLKYSNIYKGYLYFQPQTHKILVSRNVIFNENSFPFHNQQLSSVSATPPINSNCQLNIIPSSNYTNDQNTHTSSISPTTAPATPISSIHHTPPTKHLMVTRQQTNNLKPKQFKDHHVYITTESNEFKLTCYTQAVKHDLWRPAMASELDVLV